MIGSPPPPPNTEFPSTNGLSNKISQILSKKKNLLASEFFRRENFANIRHIYFGSTEEVYIK